MFDFLYSFDKTLLLYCNQTLSNPFFDTVMPILTDLNKVWYGRLLYASLWFSLFLFGGKKGRIVALLLVPLIVMSDQLSSAFIKNIIQRSRPCWDQDGTKVVPGLRLLVECGGGYSFPSSHAVNNFAVAVFISQYFRKWTFLLFFIACTVAFTRIYVGVHYPSDALGGACLGSLIAMGFIKIWSLLGKRYPNLAISEKEILIGV